jgi:predicted dehydrogenase
MRLGEVLAHVSVSVAHRAVSRLVVTGDAGELEATGTLGARGDGELLHRAPRQAPVAIAFEAESPYAAQLRAFAARARAGFTDDPALLANLDLLDRIAEPPPGVS